MAGILNRAGYFSAARDFVDRGMQAHPGNLSALPHNVRKQRLKAASRAYNWCMSRNLLDECKDMNCGTGESSPCLIATAAGVDDSGRSCGAWLMTMSSGASEGGVEGNAAGSGKKCLLGCVPLHDTKWSTTL
jgi:hypothetical protein